MADITISASEFPDVAYDKELTFAGVLMSEFYKTGVFAPPPEMKKEWAPSTASRYLADFRERILPAIVRLFGKEKPLHSYTMEDMEDVVNLLRQMYHVPEKRLQHYRFLLLLVYKAGVQAKYYVDNIFWDELIDPIAQPDEYEKHRANALTRIRKSFSISEEIQLMKWFSALDPVTASGTDVGLACMFFLGCRNNEACGANFAAFHTLSAYPDMAVFDMLQTTSENSNITKGSGKTSNAPRTLPVPPVLYNFIMKRRDALNKKIASGELELPEGIKTVDMLPVTCIGDQYTERAQSGDLSRAGRTLFQSVGIGKSELAILQELLLSGDFRETQIEEKDPTTYLLRRNTATRLYHLGFPWTTIQYWIAHEIEDALLMRNHFADEDTLYAIGQHYFKHPIFHVLEGWEEYCSHNDHRKVFAMKSKETLLIKATALEPNQPVTLKVENSNGRMRINVTELPEPAECSSQVDILGALCRAYQNCIETKIG